jgi:hypothetical protein
VIGLTGPTKHSAGLMEIDYEILRALPIEGTRLVEHVPLAPRVKAITERVTGNKVPSSQIAGRLMALRHMGYAMPVRVMPLMGGHGWQRSHEGDALLKEYDANHKEAELETALDDAADWKLGPRKEGL